MVELRGRYLSKEKPEETIILETAFPFVYNYQNIHILKIQLISKLLASVIYL